MNKTEKLIFFLCLSLSPIMSLADDYNNFMGITFKKIPTGSFYMGSCRPDSLNKNLKIQPQCPSGGIEDPDAFIDETSQRKVTITKAFYLGIYEITLGQFKRYIEATGKKELLSAEFQQANAQGDDAAVTHVSWNDIQVFTAWLNQQDSEHHYRLPTEAEWEYAARAGSESLYPWGNDPAEATHYAWYKDNSYDQGKGYAHRVGQKQPNAWGLYDMQGNVFEWVNDWYEDRKTFPATPVTDPKGGIGKHRVIRGGSWFFGVKELRSAFRAYYQAKYRRSVVGFRLVREIGKPSFFQGDSWFFGVKKLRSAFREYYQAKKPRSVLGFRLEHE